MPIFRQQVPQPITARFHQLSLLLLLCYGGGMLGCEKKPRANAWEVAPLDVPDRMKENAVSEDSLGRFPTSHKSSEKIRIFLNADPGRLHPMVQPSVWTTRILLDTVFETLVRYLPLSNGTSLGGYQAGLAQTWTIGKGGKEILLQLDPLATFQDGTALTSADVLFSLRFAIRPGMATEHHRLYIPQLRSITVLGPHKLRLQLTAENAFVLRQLSRIPIMPAHIYAKTTEKLVSSGVLDADGNMNTWVGSGPYLISKGPEHNYRLKRYEGYWRQKPEIEEIEFVWYKDASVAIREAKDERIDIIPELIAEHYPQQLKSPGVKENFQVLELAPANLSYLVLNCRKPPFDDPLIRRAVAHAIDTENLAIMEGGLTEAVAGFVWPEGPGGGSELTPLEYKLEESKRLLKLVGWRDDDGDGVREKDGRRMMVTVLVSERKNPLRDQVLAALRKAGLVLDVRVGNVAVLRKRLQSEEFDLAFVRWTGNYDRDLSVVVGSHGKQNYGGFQNATIDLLLGRIQKAWNPTHRAALLDKLGVLLQEYLPVIALTKDTPHGIVHNRIAGLRVWNGWFSIRNLSIKKGNP